MAVVPDARVDQLGLNRTTIPHSIKTAPIDLRRDVASPHTVRRVLEHIHHRLMQRHPVAGDEVLGSRVWLDESQQPLELRDPPDYYGRFGFEPSAPLGIVYPPVGEGNRLWGSGISGAGPT